MNESSLNNYLSVGIMFWDFIKCISHISPEVQLAYAEARARQPSVGRRQLKLQTVSQFWKLSKAEKLAAVQQVCWFKVSIIIHTYCFN
jgi:hypothetical protein